MSITMSVAAPRFGRVLTAMVTPFDNDGALDLEGAATLARWLVANGSDGLVVAGTTGEAPVLTDDERMDLIEAVAASVSVPVLAGTTTNDTAHSWSTSGDSLLQPAKPTGTSRSLRRYSRSHRFACGAVRHSHPYGAKD